MKKPAAKQRHKPVGGKLIQCPDCDERTLNAQNGICENPDCDQIPF